MSEDLFVEVVLEAEAVKEHGDRVRPSILGSGDQDWDRYVPASLAGIKVRLS